VGRTARQRAPMGAAACRVEQRRDQRLALTRPVEGRLGCRPRRLRTRPIRPRQQTITAADRGGGTLWSPAIEPAPSFALSVDPARSAGPELPDCGPRGQFSTTNASQRDRSPL
jgi:hypothetical protein